MRILASLAVCWLTAGIAQPQGTEVKLFVTGDVQRAGAYALQNQAGILSAIAAAHGLREAAGPAEVIIMRQGRRIHININDLLGDRTKDIFLTDGDVLVVVQKPEGIRK